MLGYISHPRNIQECRLEYWDHKYYRKCDFIDLPIYLFRFHFRVCCSSSSIKKFEASSTLNSIFFSFISLATVSCFIERHLNSLSSFKFLAESTKRGILGSRIPRKVLPSEEGFAQKWLSLSVVPELSETSTTKVVLEVQWGICPVPCVLCKYTVIFA